MKERRREPQRGQALPLRRRQEVDRAQGRQRSDQLVDRVGVGQIGERLAEPPGPVPLRQRQTPAAPVHVQARGLGGGSAEDLLAPELVGGLLDGRGEARGNEEHGARSGRARRGRVGARDLDSEFQRSRELLARVVLPDDRRLQSRGLQPVVFRPGLGRVAPAPLQPGQL